MSLKQRFAGTLLSTWILSAGAAQAFTTPGSGAGTFSADNSTTSLNLGSTPGSGYTGGSYGAYDAYGSSGAYGWDNGHDRSGWSNRDSWNHRNSYDSDGSGLPWEQKALPNVIGQLLPDPAPASRDRSQGAGPGAGNVFANPFADADDADQAAPADWPLLLVILSLAAGLIGLGALLLRNRSSRAY